MMNYCCYGSYTPFPTLKNKIWDQPFFLSCTIWCPFRIENVLKKTSYFKVQKFSPNYFREKNVILLAYKKPSMYLHKIKVIVAGTQAESTSNAKYHQK